MWFSSLLSFNFAVISTLSAAPLTVLLCTSPLQSFVPGSTVVSERDECPGEVPVRFHARLVAAHVPLPCLVAQRSSSCTS